MKEKKLYHVSHIAGLSVLEPKVSTHGKSYVYATRSLPVALLFGSYKSMGDLDGMYGGGCNGCKPYFYEGFEGSFKRRFEQTESYIYEVDPTDFEEGKTSYAAELVSEKPVKVLKCTKIDDLHKTLLDLAEKGELDLRFYEKNNPQYVETMNNHIRDRIIKFGILEDKEAYSYKFCKWYHTHILEELELKTEIDN